MARNAVALEEQPTTAPPATAPVVLRLDQIMVSREGNQPRQHFDTVKMEELTASVRRLGVLQPVLVRPSPSMPDSYELVAGERRYRAAKAVGITEIPALLRTLTDVEVLEIQVLENLQRADLHPLEEAEGYATLVRIHGRTVHEIAERIGKSDGYVYSRMKLVELGPEGRQHLLEGTLDATVALLLARIADPGTQAKALRKILDLDSPESLRQALTFRDAKETIESDYQKRLKAATFDREDAELDQVAGACSACIKNTGVAPSLFAGDKKGEDMCLDPKCFAGKEMKAWEARTAKAKEQGKKVLPPSKAKGIFDPYATNKAELIHSAAYVKLSDAVPAPTSTGPGKAPTWKQALGKDAPEIIVAVAPNGTLVELIPKKAALEAAAAKGLAWAKAETRKTEQHDWQAENAKREEKAKLMQSAAEEAIPKLVTAAAKRGADAPFLRFVASVLGQQNVAVYQRHGCKEKSQAGIATWVGKLKAEALCGLIVDLAVSRYAVTHVPDFGREILDACELYRVDLKGAWKRLQSEAKAAAKAGAGKVAKGKGKKAEVISGVCRECGCTDATPCPAGCAWVDAEETLCSACGIKAEQSHDLDDEEDGAGEEE